MREILNSDDRSGGLQPGGTLSVQVAPFGSFTGILRGEKKPRRITQTLDRAAFDRIISAWNAAGSPELLVDADHDSANGGSTRAYAWASNLRIVENSPSSPSPLNPGLYADFKFTEEGAKVVNDREFRFVSPVFECDRVGQALALTSIALTNRPNLPVSCILNTSVEGCGLRVEDDTQRSAPNAQPPTTRKEHNMEKILAALGLAEGATEDEAVAAIDALQKRASDAEAKVLNQEAEAFADRNKERIENREAFVKLFVQHGRETAESFLAATKATTTNPQPPTPPAKRIVANSAQPPANTVSASASSKIAARNAAVSTYMTAHRCDFQTAWSACRLADPDTFTD